MPVYNGSNSSLGTLTSIQLENLSLMADTDVRSILQSLEAAATAQQAVNSRIDDTRTLLSKVKNATTAERKVQIEKPSFVLTGLIWIAQCIHDLDDDRPSVTIYDNNGDEQLIQFVAKTKTSGILELTQAQYDGNAFPLLVSVIGVYKGAYPYRETDSVSFPGFTASFKVYYGYMNRFGQPGFEGGFTENPYIIQAFITPFDFFVYTWQGGDYYKKIDGRSPASLYISISRQEYETKQKQPGVINF